MDSESDRPVRALRATLTPHEIKWLLVASLPIGAFAAAVGIFVNDWIVRGSIQPITWASGLIAALVGLVLGPWVALGGLSGYALAARINPRSVLVRLCFVVLGAGVFISLPFIAAGASVAVPVLLAVTVPSAALSYLVAISRSR